MTEPAPFGTYAPRGFAARAIRFTRTLPDTWVGRRGLVAVRRLVTPHLGGGPVDVEALGIKMRLRPYNNICEKRMLFAPQTFDAEELAILRARIRPDFVFLDIGANVGAYALHVASLAGPTARILAVEPQPDIFERLTYNIRLNGLPTIKALDCAVADKPGEVTLFLDSRNAGESSVKIVTSGGAKALRVPAVTLLDLAQDEGFARIDALKLDVEGAEDLILEPFLAAAPDALRPALLILENRAERWQANLSATLDACGYRLLARTRLNLVYERANVAELRHV